MKWLKNNLLEVFIESKNLNYIHNNIFVVKNNNVKVFGNLINKIKGINFMVFKNKLLYF
jgi:hypothetical protein